MNRRDFMAQAAAGIPSATTDADQAAEPKRPKRQLTNAQAWALLLAIELEDALQGAIDEGPDPLASYPEVFRDDLGHLLFLVRFVTGVLLDERSTGRHHPAVQQRHLARLEKMYGEVA
ncbi:MAG: hypothetical protein JNM56_32850 [Planctomycetia bacterium]|nr:hypothetical protein [Planctomycetia bacterium]